jgi:hypothetical protein
MPTAAYSIAEFCRAHRVSRAFFYVLQKRGDAPEVMKVGKRRIVAHEALLAQTHGSLGGCTSLARRRAVMSGLLLMHGEKMRVIGAELAEHDDLRFVIPILQGFDQGLAAGRIWPGEVFERPTRRIAWIMIINDRDPGAAGPTSFDAGTLQWLFADAHAIAVDAAEPHAGLYEYLVEEGLKGHCILIVQTVERRIEVWREFSQHKSRIYGVLEVTPDTKNPGRPFAWTIARFDRRTPSRA